MLPLVFLMLLMTHVFVYEVDVEASRSIPFSVDQEKLTSKNTNTLHNVDARNPEDPIYENLNLSTGVLTDEIYEIVNVDVDDENERSDSDNSLLSTLIPSKTTHVQGFMKATTSGSGKKNNLDKLTYVRKIKKISPKKKVVPNKTPKKKIV